MSKTEPITVPVPRGAFLAQRLYYVDGQQLCVFWHRRKVYIRTGSGEYPICPITRRPQPHPDEGRESGSADYETLGLYYGFGMPETGWGSEGEF